MILLAAVVVVLALWKVPERQALKNATQFAQENAARTTLAQILGGSVLLAGLYISSKSFGLSRQGQITDRFTKAIEQLGKTDGAAPNIEVRLGAIYALERIALDSPRDHWTIMEILTAYVRQNAPNYPDAPYRERPRTDIQAVLTVVGRRRTGPQRERPGHALDLSRSYLHGADLARANLQGATLAGTSLQHATLAEANLQNARLRYANLKAALLEEANLQNADLTGVVLQSARLVQANLQQATLGEASLKDTILTDADLRDAYLAGADLQNARLSMANLRGADLVNASLQGADLNYTDLRRARWLTVEQVTSATNWEFALYSGPFCHDLGLPPAAEAPATSPAAN